MVNEGRAGRGITFLLYSVAGRWCARARGYMPEARTRFSAGQQRAAATRQPPLPVLALCACVCVCVLLLVDVAKPFSFL